MGLEIAPSPIAFATTTIGFTSAQVTVTVTNTGPGSESLTAASIVPSTEGFAIDTDTGETLLFAAGVRTLEMSFQPAAVGAKAADLSFNSGALTESMSATALPQSRVDDTMLYTSAFYIDQEVGNTGRNAFPRGHQSTPEVERAEAKTIRAASATMRAALCQGGYNTLAAGRQLTGTITTDGTTVVVGAGTLFTAELQGQDASASGSILVSGGESHTVLSIEDDENLTLKNAHAGAAIGANAFTVNGDGTTVAELILYTTLLTQKKLRVGNSGMTAAQMAMADDVERWLEEVRAGRKCFGGYLGATIAPQASILAIVPETSAEPVNCQLDAWPPRAL